MVAIDTGYPGYGFPATKAMAPKGTDGPAPTCTHHRKGPRPPFLKGHNLLAQLATKRRSDMWTR
jgi:hypothetical protein